MVEAVSFELGTRAGRRIITWIITKFAVASMVAMKLLERTPDSTECTLCNLRAYCVNMES